MRWAAQFYTLRDHVKTASGLRDAFERVKQMGYEGVQISATEAFEKEVSPETLREWLDELQLVCCATHRPWDQLLNQTAREIEIHKIIGCNHVGIGMGPKGCYDGGETAWKSWLEDARRVIEAFSAAGLTFCFHNHAVEFELKEDRRAIDILIDDSDPRMQFILDTYWVVHSGADCTELVKRLDGRIDVVHLKDKSVHGWETRMAPVGRGNLPWSLILPAMEESGTQWGVVEQDDCYGEDPFACLEESLRNLQALKSS